MKQVFIFGASSAYGVGATTSGWADLVKSHFHTKMYAPDGVGEAYEVFNFSKSGSTIEFAAKIADWIYEHYGRGGDILTLVSVGGNDAKAKGSPDNYVCSSSEFEQKLSLFLDALLTHSTRVIFVSNGYVDEAKTNPKPSPFTNGEPSYFTNERRMLFNSIARRICEDKGIDFIAADIDQDRWIQNYLYMDGLHPNQAGYDVVFKALRPFIDTY